MKKTYIAIADFNTIETTITLYNNNTVVFNIKKLLEKYNIIKVDVDWESWDGNFYSDYNICYKKENIYRGNMLNIICSEPDNSILSTFEHVYNLDYNKELSTEYLTILNFYTIDGSKYTIRIKINFSSFDFFDIFGNIDILNSQFMINDYNYVFLTAETKTNYIINYCLKQLANRSNAKSSKIIIQKTNGEGDIVTIGDSNTYITTINGDPLYLISNETV